MNADPQRSTPGGSAAGRDPQRTVRIGVLQAGAAHSRGGNPGPASNFALFARLAAEAAATRPDLIAFPEYAISGWPYPPEQQMNGLAEPIPGDGPWYAAYRRLAAETHTPLLGALVEADGGRLYNCAFLLDATGSFVGKYRKVHANLGEQTWWGWSQGEGFRLIEHDGVRYGISICADMWFPETVRCWELLGADLVVHISIGDDMGHLVPARAFDSELPIVMSIFQGGSYAVDARGNLLHKLPADSAGWHVFELRPFAVRTAKKYGGLWIPKRGHQNLRNLPAYGPLVDPAFRPPWTEVFLDEAGNRQTKDELRSRFRGRYDVCDPADGTK
ncbi:MAG: carbon-nitrogen hydrolase family protein [Kiritimatiellae bacterium]|nr:carbon-nitrogen hydrolase family protein [Kiritimatiellia bacterium]